MSVSHIKAPSTIVFACGDFSAVITECEDNRYAGEWFQLEWTDYVANEWTETFSTLSAATARLALLIACAETEFELAFSGDAPAFETDFKAFTKEHLS